MLRVEAAPVTRYLRVTRGVNRNQQLRFIVVVVVFVVVFVVAVDGFIASVFIVVIIVR